jgi:hypothetical protein
VPSLRQGGGRELPPKKTAAWGEWEVEWGRTGPNVNRRGFACLLVDRRLGRFRTLALSVEVGSSGIFKRDSEKPQKMDGTCRKVWKQKTLVVKRISAATGCGCVGSVVLDYAKSKGKEERRRERRERGESRR